MDVADVLYASSFIKCVVVQKKTKKKRNTSISFYTNYHTEMKLVPIIKD